MFSAIRQQKRWDSGPLGQAYSPNAAFKSLNIHGGSVIALYYLFKWQCNIKMKHVQILQPQNINENRFQRQDEFIDSSGNSNVNQ